MYARSMAGPGGAAKIRGVMYVFPSAMISSTSHGAMMWPRYVASAVAPTMAISLSRE
jgi:hypothetical protein